MQIALSRKECRRRMLARLGHTTSDAQAPLVLDQFNEWIRAACDEVYTRCEWVRTLRESVLAVGIDQRVVNYPANCGPENIHQIGLWDADADRYLPLRRGIIPVEVDDDPLVIEGEPASVPGRGTPTMYQAKQQIEVWPRPDKAYELKVDHTINPGFASDEQLSIVDAELIILWAMADAFDFQGDADLARTQRQKFANRLGMLAGKQGPMVTISRDSTRRQRVNDHANGGQFSDYQPNSGTWPSVMDS